MKVLSIGSDRKIFEAGSPVRERMVEYGETLGELHIIVFSLASHKLQKEQISEKVWAYPTSSKSRWHYIFDAKKVFKREIKDQKFDVLTVQDPFESALAGNKIRKISPLPFHIQIHTDFLSKYFIRSSILNRIRVWIAKRTLFKADSIRVVSHRIKDSLEKLYPNLANKTEVLPIYTDLSNFRNSEISENLKLKYKQFDFVILMASRLTHEKNIGLAFKVLKELVIKNPKTGLVIIGDGPEKEYLKNLALHYQVDRNVVFEPWQNDLVSYYKSADVFLLTSLYEGYGLTLMEAVVSGCLVVTSDVGIAKEIIKDSENGFVCDITKPETFVEKLLLLVQNKELYNEMKQNAGEIAQKKLGESKENYLNKYKSSLEKAINNFIK